MSFRVTLAATRAEGEAVAHADDLFADCEQPPVIVADEPDESRPDDWVIHAYFERRPNDDDLRKLGKLAKGKPRIEELGEDDWVTMSQAGLAPIRAGRFHVHTPIHPPIADAINFEIDAGLAFGTGQHATTAGCLLALDRLAAAGNAFTNIADIGTGTGLLAFAALTLWPDAKAIASDIDPISIDVTRDNARINGVALGHGEGQLLLAEAAGLDHAIIAARAPFDLLIANILAAPLIDLAPSFASSVSSGGKIVLAGLLEAQVDRVMDAYVSNGCALAERTGDEWPVLVLTR